MEWLSIEEHGKPNEYNRAYVVLNVITGSIHIFFLDTEGKWFEISELDILNPTVVEYEDSSVTHYIRIPDLPEMPVF